MTEYQKFLEKNEIISEADFNEVIESMPKINYDIPIDWITDKDDLAFEIICLHLRSHKFYCVGCTNVSFEDKTFEINNVCSEDDLNKIVKMFPGWTISNYNQLLEDIKNYEKETNSEIEINEFIINLPIKSKLKIAKVYGYEG